MVKEVFEKKECNKEKRLKKKGGLSIEEKMAQCQEGQALKYAIFGDSGYMDYNLLLMPGEASLYNLLLMPFHVNMIVYAKK